MYKPNQERLIPIANKPNFSVILRPKVRIQHKNLQIFDADNGVQNYTRCMASIKPSAC